MPAPNKPNTEEARRVLAAKRAAARADRESAAVALLLDGDALALMIRLMRQRRDRIESDMSALRTEHEQVSQWLAENDPQSPALAVPDDALPDATERALQRGLGK